MVTVFEQDREPRLKNPGDRDKEPRHELTLRIIGCIMAEALLLGFALIFK